MYRFDPTDVRWDRIAGYFPDRYHHGGAGHPWNDHRPLVNGILWHLQIPTRKDQRRDEGFEKMTYRRRNIVERVVGWFKWCRALATRYDKLAVNYTGLWIIAEIQNLLRRGPKLLHVRLSETT